MAIPVTGSSAGAGLGACAAILWGLSIVYPAVRILRRADGGRGRLVDYASGDPPRSDLNPVLVGIALGTLCGAGISLIKTLAGDPPSYRQLPSGLLGLSTVTLRDLCYAADHSSWLLALFFLRWRMNLLTLSDDEARSLGLNVTRLRFGLIVCATPHTASTVAIAGIIGWSAVCRSAHCPLVDRS